MGHRMPGPVDLFCKNGFPVVKQDRLGRQVKDQFRVIGKQMVICGQHLIYSVTGTELRNGQPLTATLRQNLSLDSSVGSGHSETDACQRTDHTVSGASVFRQGHLRKLPCQSIGICFLQHLGLCPKSECGKCRVVLFRIDGKDTKPGIRTLGSVFLQIGRGKRPDCRREREEWTSCFPN